MKLAAADAVIPPAKLRDYLLSTAHPDGRSKAVFLAQLGYSRDAWQTLERDLRTQLASPAEPGGSSPYGKKYEILGMLTGPNGTGAWVRTVWIILTGETRARLVTLIPEERQ
jgi:Domain of unknown function (DUF6883)